MALNKTIISGSSTRYARTSVGAPGAVIIVLLVAFFPGDSSVIAGVLIVRRPFARSLVRANERMWRISSLSREEKAEKSRRVLKAKALASARN